MRLLVLALLLTALPSFADDVKAEAKARIQDIEQAINDWDLPTAKRELIELEKLVPKDIEPLQYFRGRIAFEEGRYDDAVKLLQAAGVDDKPGSYLRLAIDSQKITQGYARAESAHFIFLYPPGKDEILAPYALETLEAQRAALEKDLGFAPPGKTRVEILSNFNELAKESTLTRAEIDNTGTIAICKFNKLMVTSPKAVLRGYDWQDTLAHEYTHLVVSEKSHNTVPIWLHEGIAKYFETRWRGAPGQAITPSSLALLGERVRKNKLVPFEKMHPSIALLPTAEDAATAFAEVFFAVDYIYKNQGDAGLRAVIDQLAQGKDDKHAVEVATGKPFPAFERAWLAYIRKQPFPSELIPHDYGSTEELAKRVQAGGKGAKEKDKNKEISFGDFTEVEETDARKLAHLGELMRERNRHLAAAEEYGRAHAVVGDKYESVSNKYALALLDVNRPEEAEKVLLGSLKLHPGSPTTHVHLGRVYLRKKDYPDAKRAYLDALAADPFDEEIHVALAVIGDALHDSALADRARKAAALLTGVPADKVSQLGHALTEPDQGAAPEPVTQANSNAAELRKALASKGPSRGPATAPVTIVEFSDFQCPSCRRAHDTIEQLLLAYPGKLRLVYRHFPLEMHEHAELAAEAAQCADEQGKFWPYHDALFENQAHLLPKDLLGYARALSLDGARFSECLESGRQSRAVRDDLAAGESAGVNATPTFFVNGAKVVGALELDEFKRIVDEQLGAN